MHARSLAVAGLLTASLAFPACSDEPDKAVLKAGERLFVKCRSCHSIDKDGGNMTGPNLWGVYGAKAGSNEEFPYSDAVKNSGIVWSDETIGKWLANPSTFLRGTKMAFIGLPNEQDRAALLAYLKKKSSEE